MSVNLKNLLENSKLLFKPGDFIVFGKDPFAIARYMIISFDYRLKKVRIYDFLFKESFTQNISTLLTYYCKHKFQPEQNNTAVTVTRKLKCD